jgi:hypothetical protein
VPFALNKPLLTCTTHCNCNNSNDVCPAGTLLATMFLLFHWVEQKRIGDFYKPGSQGDGSFFGITDDFKGTENGYPGARRSTANTVLHH